MKRWDELLERGAKSQYGDAIGSHQTRDLDNLSQVRNRDLMVKDLWNPDKS